MKYIIFLFGFLSINCGDPIREITKTIDAMPDPTERGLMYIAFAIIFSAIIRAIFNK